MRQNAHLFYKKKIGHPLGKYTFPHTPTCLAPSALDMTFGLQSRNQLLKTWKACIRALLLLLIKQRNHIHIVMLQLESITFNTPDDDVEHVELWRQVNRRRVDVALL
jgi:hypothetical protein